MASYQVICITKPHPTSSHEHITHIGYYESLSRPRIIITVEDAIRRIDHNKWEFYVSAQQGTAYVEVVRLPNRRPFIKTIPDRTQKDNLLTLPQC
jgi:hypothetical protein